MKTLALCATIVAVAAWFGWVRHHQVTELRRQNIELRASADEVLRYHSESAELEQETIDTNELQRLRAERSELMKLRSAIGRLRRTAKIELPQIQRQVEAMVTQTADVQQRASGILAERAAKQISKLTREFLGDLNSSVWIVAKANGGRFPTSLAEMEMIWRALPEERRTRYVRDEAGTFLNVLVRTNHLSPRETELTGASFSVSARSFEFMRFERPLNTKDPPVPFIRETTPRQFPNGKFARYYGFTDGRVAEAVVGDGNFTQWEREPPQAEDSKMN